MDRTTCTRAVGCLCVWWKKTLHAAEGASYICLGSGEPFKHNSTVLWYRFGSWWQKQRKIEVGSWGWTSASDRAERAPLGLHISPEQPRALPLAAGPSLFHRDCLMLCNEPHNTPRWPSGDFGLVPSPAFLPPLLSVCFIHQEGRCSSHQDRVIVLVMLVILKKIGNINFRWWCR